MNKFTALVVLVEFCIATALIASLAFAASFPAITGDHFVWELRFREPRLGSTPW